MKIIFKKRTYINLSEINQVNIRGNIAIKSRDGN